MIDTRNLRPELQNAASIDTRHRQMLAELTIASKVRSVLEIGCASGYSTAMWAHLLDLGLIDHLTVCDVEIIERVRELGDKIEFVEMSSLDYLPTVRFGRFGLIFADGSHTTEIVATEKIMVHNAGPTCVAAHDTGYWTTDDDGRFAPCARDYKFHFQSLSYWYVLEDAWHRRGEATHRGLMFATRDLNIYSVAQPIFAANGFS